MLLQAMKLIAHQGVQRADDDAQAGAEQCRQPVAKRLSATRGHKRQGREPGQYPLKYFVLIRTNIVITKDVPSERRNGIANLMERDILEGSILQAWESSGRLPVIRQMVPDMIDIDFMVSRACHRLQADLGMRRRHISRPLCISDDLDCWQTK